MVPVPEFIEGWKPAPWIVEALGEKSGMLVRITSWRGNGFLEVTAKTIFKRMAKRIHKTNPPKSIFKEYPSGDFSAYCEVYVPQSPMIFTYAVPTSVQVRRGSVVWIQLGKRKPSLAVVSQVTTEKPAFPKIKQAFPHESGYAFGERYMEKLDWVSRYYMATPMQSLNVFLPKDFGNYLDALLQAENEKKSEEENERGEASPGERESEPPLTLEQQSALEALAKMLDGTGFRGALLHGVTGSGKTRVYMELAKRALTLGKKILVLVPEIGLAPQIAERFSKSLGFEVPLIHSALSAPIKRKSWLSILSGRATIVIGTRSAILSPFEYDLVILDEEHDSSYKQEDSAPHYHARTLAFHEAAKWGGLVLLGSATPSVETFWAAKSRKLHYLVLSHRATEVELPKVSIVDMKKKWRKQDSSLLLSSELREALTKTVENGDQAIILMNRRGYSKSRVCSECGNTFCCPVCKVPLIYHKQHNGLLCHYCGRIFSLQVPCPDCGSKHFELLGGAIEKLEEEIAEWIPQARTIRMDRDTTANVGAAERILNDFRERKFSVLLGTQIVAKGHDFPDVQLVGIVGAEAGAGVPNFRSGERLFELLSQTSGRAGRAKGNGTVILQTNNPDDPIIQLATTHDYLGFAEKELASRFDAHYPPYKKLAEVRLGHRNETFLHEKAERFAEMLSQNSRIEVLGPVDAYIPWDGKTFWMHLLIKAERVAEIREALSPLPQDLEVRINIDPI